MASNTLKLPLWIVLWLFLSSILVVLDALFVLLRPRTMPGGDLNFFVSYYNIYIDIDRRYGDMKDGFVIGQSWMNLVEVFLNCIGLMLNMKSSVYTQPFVLIATTMTFSKTVLYFLMSSPLCFGDMYFTGLSWLKFVFLFIVPSGFWVVFPLFCIISITLQLAHTIQSKHKSN
ncbi:uncharacterized protein LOC110240530 [Exaiptasia diaphana]|uniref:EXPERA domain-containing protein n=1 Tax=Exaiptasia diaphana TaxID=2652724 RepID=A0A913XBI9_EXADI|nr:uncharacterized protein LOC110240530 [Exaiptasia diaphana]KXJ26473.1 hypothetical protein AC249_AIPGENE15528 [Exaiptasia diaphana]